MSGLTTTHLYAVVCAALQQVFEAESMLEHRLLQYVVLGDFATAVAFLLSMPPESSVRWGHLLLISEATTAVKVYTAFSSSETPSVANLQLSM